MIFDFKIPYSDLYSKNRDALVFINQQSKILTANPAFCEMTGYSIQELQALTTFYDLSVPENNQETLRLFYQAQLSEQGYTLPFEKEILKKNGSRLSVEIQVYTVAGQTETDDGYIWAVVRDISKRKHLEQTLKQSREKLEEAQEISGIGSYIWNIRNDSLTWSANMYKIAGLDPDNFYGNLSDVMKNMIHPDDFPGIAKEIKAMVETGRTWPMEFRLIRPDGDIRVLRSTSRFEFDDQNRPVICNGIHFDITHLKKTEHTLSVNEQKFRQLADSSDQVIWETNKKGVLTYISDTVQSVLGYHPDELLGTPAVDHFPENEKLRLLKLFDKQSTPTQNKSDLIYQVYDKNRKIHFVEIMSTPLYNLNQELEGFFGTLHDETNRMERNAELNATIKLYQIQNSVNDLSELINQSLDLVQEWTQSDALGIRILEGDDFPFYTSIGFSEKFLKMENSICSTGAEKIDCMCGQVVKRKFDPEKPWFTPFGSFWTNHSSQLLESNHKLSDFDNFRFNCNSLGYESIVLIPLNYGERTFGLLQLNSYEKTAFSIQQIEAFERFATNLTIGIAQRRDEKALFQSIQEKQVILNSSTELIVFYNLDFEILWGNKAACESMGMPPDKLIGKRCYKLWGKSNTPCTGCPVIKVFESNQSQQAEIFTPDQKIWQIRAFPVFNESGNLTNVVEFGQDITLQRQAEIDRLNLEEQYRQAQKMESIGRLAGGIAHDLNNLLTPVLGYSELIMEEIEPDNPHNESLQQIIAASLKAKELVKQLLAYSRKQTLKFILLDINKMLDDFQKLLRRTIRENISIETKLNRDLPLVKSDRIQLEQVILNLCVNAQDAITGNGSIDIETGLEQCHPHSKTGPSDLKPGQYVTITVQDNGSGMSSDVQEKIFEPFYTTKSLEQGTGLGLATVFGIVKQHGGHISVDSKPGKGSAFKIWLPVTDTPITKCPDHSDWIDITAQPSGTIVVVEDDRLVKELTEKILQKNGYTVFTASNGAEAIEVLNNLHGNLDLLLTDVIMPGMTGKELADTVKVIFPDIKILYMSGYSAKITAQQGLQGENPEIIQKPFTTKDLLSKITSILKKS